MTITIKNLGALQISALEIYVLDQDACCFDLDGHEMFRGHVDVAGKSLWFDDEDRGAVYRRLVDESNALEFDDADLSWALTRLASRVLKAVYL